jgi:hypothetical protein
MYDTGTWTVESTTFEIVASAYQSDLSYAFHDALLLKDDEGNLFYFEDSGCSCTYFGEDATLADLTPVKSAAEAVELAKASFSSEDVYDFAQQAVKL